MKKWVRPSIVVFNYEQLNTHILAVANSDCIVRYVR